MGNEGSSSGVGYGGVQNATGGILNMGNEGSSSGVGYVKILEGLSPHGDNLPWVMRGVLAVLGTH